MLERRYDDLIWIEAEGRNITSIIMDLYYSTGKMFGRVWIFIEEKYLKFKWNLQKSKANNIEVSYDDF